MAGDVVVVDLRVFALSFLHLEDRAALVTRRMPPRIEE